MLPLQQSSGIAGVPTGPSLWAGLCLEAATLNSMPTRHLSTEVALLSYEDATHFKGLVSRIPWALGFESQPPLLCSLPQHPLLKCSYPLLNLSSSNVKHNPFFFSPWALPCLSNNSLCSWHSVSCFGEASFKALSCPALLGRWVTAAQCWKALRLL